MTRLVLATTSKYRQRLLAESGLDADVVAPDFDERSLDPFFDEWGVERYVVEVAAGKARSAIDRVDAGSVVIAADQAAVLDGRLLTKPGTVEAAVAQLGSMAGRSHELVNGIVAMVAGDPDDGIVSAVDRHIVTMRGYSEAEARAYVEAYLPLDTVGAYRLEDDAGLIESIVGSGDDGVIGLPVAVVRGLVSRLGGR